MGWNHQPDMYTYWWRWNPAYSGEFPSFTLEVEGIFPRMGDEHDERAVGAPLSQGDTGAGPTDGRYCADVSTWVSKCSPTDLKRKNPKSCEENCYKSQVNSSIEIDFLFFAGWCSQNVQEVVLAMYHSRGSVIPKFLNSNPGIMESVYVNVFMFAMVNRCFVRSSYVNMMYPILGSYYGTW